MLISEWRGERYPRWAHPTFKRTFFREAMTAAPVLELPRWTVDDGC